MIETSRRIRTKQQLKEWLDLELPFYSRYSTPLKRFICIDEQSILRKHQLLLRKCEYCTNTGKKFGRLFYRLRLLRIQTRYSLNIPLNCAGKGLKIMHLGPILINEAASIGENCSLHINTGIVADGRNGKSPALGNHIVVGIGAVILGDIHIADGVAIGANAVVNKDITEPNIAVAGVPAHKISSNGKNTWSRDADQLSKMKSEQNREE